MLILYIVAEKNLSSKAITPKLSSNLQNISIVNSKIAKTLSINNNQEQDVEKESKISWVASFYEDI